MNNTIKVNNNRAIAALESAEREFDIAMQKGDERACNRISLTIEAISQGIQDGYLSRSVAGMMTNVHIY